MSRKRGYLGALLVVLFNLVHISAVCWAQTDERLLIFPGGTLELPVPRRDVTAIQSVEITPPQGVRVRKIKDKKEHWYILLAADKDAAPGQRSVVVVTPQGRVAPQTIRIPDHRPVILALDIRSHREHPVTVAFDAVVFDQANDLGANPRVETMLCGWSGGFYSASTQVEGSGRSMADLLGCLAISGEA